MTKITHQQARQLRDFMQEYDKALDGFMEGYQQLFNGNKGASEYHPIEVVKILNPKVYEELSYLLFECSVYRGKHGQITVNGETLEGLDKDYESFIRILDFMDLLEEDE